MKNINAKYAAIFTIPNRGIPTTLSSPGLPLKTFPKTGFARFAESAKNSL